MHRAWERVITIEIEEHPVSAPEAGATRNQQDRIRPSGRWTIQGSSLITVAALVGLAVWFAVGYRDGETPKPQVQTSVAAISPVGLQSLSRALGHPIYWLGTRRNTTYELTTTSDGQFYVRYLPAGATVRDPRSLLTVGMYPKQDSLAIIEGLTREAGWLPISIPGGGVGAYQPAHPTHLYAAFRGVDYQIEVYAPTPGLARHLVVSGPLRAVGATVP
jgi:hypothetical protein